MSRFTTFRYVILFIVTLFVISPHTSFAGTGKTVQRGGAATINWSVSGASNCSSTTNYPGSPTVTDGIKSSWESSVRSSTDSATFSTVTAAPGNYTFTCTARDSNGNTIASDSAILTVTQADLTAGATGPTTGKVNEAITFTATVSNIGTANSVEMKNYFQWATGADGSGTITDIPSPSAMWGALAPNSSALAGSSPHTFTQAGTYSVRACADNDHRSGAGWNAESDEGNNCGDWSTITISDGTPTPTNNLPIGAFDEASCSLGARGWACDADNYNQALDVHIYNGSTMVGSVNANMTREIEVGNACGGNTAHGFSYTIPDTLKDGNPKSLTAYAINIGGGDSNPAIGTVTMAGCSTTDPICTNGATNYPDCTICPAGETMTNGQCETPDPEPICTNGATNYPDCTICPVGMVILSTGRCGYPPTPDRANLTVPQTALEPTTQTPSQGVPVNFSSMISNVGNETTGIQFPVLIQVATEIYGEGMVGGVTDEGYGMTAALASYTSRTYAFNHTFTAPGTYAIRACADKYSASGNGDILEQSDDDNCGAWVNVTVKPKTPQNLSGSCSSTGLITITGTADATISGETYPLRVDDISTPWAPTNCTTGAKDANGDFCHNGVTSFPYTFQGTPNSTYDIWGHMQYDGIASDPVSGGRVTCSPQQFPDLQAGIVVTDPDGSTVQPGTAKGFKVGIFNRGNASTGSGFSNIIQVATGADGAGTITTKPASSMSALASGASSLYTFSHTFTSPGTYSMRACADKSSATNMGTIDEGTNEDNNCGDWTNFDTQCAFGDTWNGTSCIAIPAPTSPLGSCSANGTTGTISWTTPSGWTTFYTRASVDGVNMGAPAWDDNFVGTTKTFPTVPGKTYTWWVHTKNAADGAWSTSVGGTFTCANAAPTTSISPTNTTIVLGDSESYALTGNDTSGDLTTLTFSWMKPGQTQWSWENGYDGGSASPSHASTFANTTARTYNMTFTPDTVGTYSLYGAARDTANPWVQTPFYTLTAIAAPANFGATCNSTGVITISGTPFSTITGETYPVRVNNLTTSSSFDAANSTGCLTGNRNGDYCIDTGTSLPQSVNGTSGHSYSVWAHTVHDNVWSPASNASVTCPAAQFPDLTAGTVVPNPDGSTVRSGVTAGFKVAIYNNGQAGTVNSFSNFVQVATQPNGGGTITSRPASSMSALASGSSTLYTFSYAFPASGEQSMRACADKSSAASTGTITESNETNNCGPWSNITVEEGTISPTGTISATPSVCTVPTNQTYCSSSIAWSTSNTTSASVRANGALWENGTSGTKSAAIDPDSPYTFTLHSSAGTQLASVSVTAQCAFGDTWNGTSCVALPAPTNAIGSCSANGTTGTVSWTAPSGYTTFYTRASVDGVNMGAPAWDDNFVGTTKTFPTVPGKTYTWWVHTKNAADGAWSTSVGGTFTCAATPMPDLTVSAITSPATVRAGTSASFSATISNIGNASTGSSFSNFTQVSTQPGGAGTLINLSSDSMSALGAGSSRTYTKSYTFASAGTYYMRVCADKTSPTSTGSVPESNEDNNCGATWTTVTVQPATLPTGTISAYANPCDVQIGQSTCISSVTWNTSDTPTASVRVNGTLWDSRTDGVRTATITQGSPSAFTLLDSNSNQLASVSVSARCVSGSTWNGTTCQQQLPDLTAGTVAPNPAGVITAGVSRSFTVTISNIGNVSTGSSFSNFMQTSTQPNGGGTLTNHSSNSMSALGAGSSRVYAKSITFASAGTYYMRACADKSTPTSTGSITESNESNNCSATWTTVTVQPAPTSPTGVISASPNPCTVPAGNSTCSTTVTWSTSNTDAVVTANGSLWDNRDDGSRTATIDPVSPYTFALNDEDGNQLDTVNTTAICTSGSTWNGSTCACPSGQTPVSGSCVTTPRPDLVSSAITLPATVRVGTAASFSATISNTGNASTGASFSNFMQVATAANGAGTITGLSSNSMSSIASGNSRVYTKSYTFASAGTYSMRACADKSSATSTGTITESNETNNCGAWTNISVTTTGCANGASNPPTCSTYTITATAGSNGTINPSGVTTVPHGGSQTYTITPASGYARSGLTVDGASVTPAATYTFTNVTGNRTINATFASTASPCVLPWGGTLAHGSSTTAYDDASVTAPDQCSSHSITRTCNNGVLSGSSAYQYDSCTDYTPPPTQIIGFGADPRTVEEGGLIKLTWSIQSPTPQCTISADVSAPETCNATCQANIAQAETDLNNTFTNGTTNQNDPYGASRSMSIALSQASSGVYARGEKSVNLDYSTVFTLTCGGTTVPAKSIIYVTKKNEG